MFIVFALKSFVHRERRGKLDTVGHGRAVSADEQPPADFSDVRLTNQLGNASELWVVEQENPDDKEHGSEKAGSLVGEAEAVAGVADVIRSLRRVLRDPQPVFAHQRVR